jgi:hypothetical protein
MALYRCPSCDVPLTQSEYSSGYCPSCRQSLGSVGGGGGRGASYGSAMSSSSYGREPVFASRPARVFSRPGLLAWCTVRTGLSLTAIGSIMILIGFIFLILLILTAPARPSGVLAVVIVLCTATSAIGAVLLVVGMLMCLPVPAESGARGWMVGTLLSLIISGLLVVIFIILDAPTEPIRRDLLTNVHIRFIMLYLLVFMIILVHVFYSAFLIAVAGYFHANGLRAGLIIYLAVSLVAQIIGLLMFVLISQGTMTVHMEPATGLHDPKVQQMLNWVGRAAQAILLIWFFIQVLLIRSTIVDQLMRSGKD